MSLAELIRTAAVIAQRDDVHEVSIVTEKDESGVQTEIEAYRCDNPDCGRIHVSSTAHQRMRFLWDADECRAVRVAAGDDDD